MKVKTTPKRTRRLMPHLHKPKRHGTTNWTTWVSPARMSPAGAPGRAPARSKARRG